MTYQEGPVVYEEDSVVYEEDPAAYGQEAAEYGLLRVFVQPENTEVFVDGEYRGVAHQLVNTALSLNPGEHNIELRHDGFSSYFDVYVSPGSTTFFGKDLTVEGQSQEYSQHPGEQRPQYPSEPSQYPSERSQYPAEQRVSQEVCPPGAKVGLVELAIEPLHARVFVDDAELGDAKNLSEAGIVLPEGDHVIRMEAPGYEPQEREIQVGCAEPTTVDVTMVQQT
jgi:hypothetical protein